MKITSIFWTALAAITLAAASVADDVPHVSHLTDDSGGRVPLKTMIPAYPEIARRDRIEGQVRVCFNVDRKGKPFRISVRKSTNRLFERPSMRAIRASTYKPLPPDKKPSGIKTCRTFRFYLEPDVDDDAQ